MGKKEVSPEVTKPNPAEAETEAGNKGKKDSVQNQNRLDTIDKSVKSDLNKLRELRKGTQCYPFLLYNSRITSVVVEDVFDELRRDFANCHEKLDVLVFSGGGNIDAAYNLALLFRRYAVKELNFIVCRWAKSAATLLVIGGDAIMMSPVAELGPLDPQITEINPLDKRLEQFSPLHIRATLDLIRDEFKNGHEKLARGLLERLQFPLTLGSFTKSVDISIDYTRRLLSSRMLTGDKKSERAETIAKKLTTGYADHSYCIDIDEAKALGLNVLELTGEELDTVWHIHKLCREREDLKRKQKQRENEKLLKNLPDDLRKLLPDQDNMTDLDQASPV